MALSSPHSPKNLVFSDLAGLATPKNSAYSTALEKFPKLLCCTKLKSVSLNRQNVTAAPFKVERRKSNKKLENRNLNSASSELWTLSEVTLT